MVYKFKVGDRLRALESILKHKGPRRHVVPGHVVVVKNLESPKIYHEDKPAYGFENNTQWYHEEHFELVLDHSGQSLKELERRERIQLASLREAHRKAGNVEVNHKAQLANLERKVVNLRTELVKRDLLLRAARESAAEAWTNGSIAVKQAPSYCKAGDGTPGLAPLSIAAKCETCVNPECVRKRMSSSAQVTAPVLAKEASQLVGLARQRRKLWVSVSMDIAQFGEVGVRWLMPVVAVAVIALAVVRVVG